MAWIHILMVILPLSCFISIAAVASNILYQSLNDYDYVHDAPGETHIPVHAAALEALALTADTALSIGLLLNRVGAYNSWRAFFGSVLPEVYLVIILAARSWAIAQSSHWAGHLELHSAALYAVRFSCAVIATGYSWYMAPGWLSGWLGPARLLLLSTLILVQPLPSLLSQ
ncbi:hypothetical protein SCUP515_08617 [Seiridium cupressi]